MRFSHRILASGLIGSLSGSAAACVALMIIALPAHSQSVQAPSSYLGEFERPYGFGYGQETQPIDANTRDANGNRLVLGGRIMSGDQSTLSSNSGSASTWAQTSAGAGFFGQSGGIAQGTSIGNQINVITQGNYNTVVVNATQTNSGDQTTVLNGNLNLQ